MSEITEKPNIKQIQERLIEMLQPSGWANLLKGYLRSSDFENLLNFLVDENLEGKRFTPSLKQLFRAFLECPVDQVKVVMIGQDPYYQPLVADGIAFSCGNTQKPEASLRYILGAIERTVPFEDRAPVDDTTKFDLVRYSKQGILLINTALTTEVGKSGKHVEQWKPFIEYLFDMLNFQKAGLIWGFMGKHAQAYQPLIGDHHYHFTSTHPAYAAYMKQSLWDCNDIFNKINNKLTDLKKEKIMW